jgi:2'-5' RNA ligase
MSAPFIVTLGLHPADQARFEALRQRHFPPALNHIPAHLTLFHHLPGDEPVLESLSMAAARQAPFDLAVNGLRSLGRGAAYTLEAAPLLQLRAALAQFWGDHLTPQDRQGWRPHITIQNKVSPEEARTLLAAMQAAFTPFTVRAEALLLWRYRGGPWEAVDRIPLNIPLNPHAPGPQP